MKAGRRRTLTKCSLVCITECDRACQASRLKPAGHNFRDTCGSDLVGAKVVRQQESTAQLSERRDRNAAESKGVTARRDWHELGQSVRVLPHTKR